MLIMQQPTLTTRGTINRNTIAVLPKEKKSLKRKPGVLVSEKSVKRKRSAKKKLIPGQARLSLFCPVTTRPSADLAVANVTDRKSAVLAATRMPVLNRSKLYKKSKRWASKQKKPVSTRAPMVIPYRDDGKGEGPFYDHFTLQKITSRATSFTLPEGATDYYLSRASHSSPFSLPYGVADKKHGHIMPRRTSNHPNRSGTLVLMGVSRSAKEKQLPSFQLRMRHETVLLEKAKRYGQPIFAICGGAWQLWQSEGGRLVDVSGHGYRGGMSYINSRGSVGRNKMMHRIRFRAGKNSGILRGGMGLFKRRVMQKYPAVNSVHWLAPGQASVPSGYTVTAKAVTDNILRSEQERKQYVSPQGGSVEAFESKYGAPQLGVQWHPEAYYGDTPAQYESERHLGLVRYMASAGDAFHARRKTVCHLEGIFKRYPNPIKLLRPVESAHRP
jgi:gamma-glutamyl-gamma-aminobutyrate hydrolase PuuD